MSLPTNFLEISGSGYELLDSHSKGSCPAGTYKKGSDEYYVKFPSQDNQQTNEIRAKNEVLAANLMKIICGEKIIIPDYFLIEGKAGTNKVHGVGSKIIADLVHNPVDQKTEDFALLFLANAFINNFDGVQATNYGTAGGKLVALDFGGAFAMHSNPSSSEAIFKDDKNTECLFAYEVTAISTMADKTKNAADMQIECPQELLKKAAQRIIDISDKAILDLVLKDGYGLLDDKKLLAENIIRRKYFIAKKYGVVPTNIKYLSITEKVNFLAKTYLFFENDAFYKELYHEQNVELTPKAVKRPKHGIEHGIVTMILILAYFDFARKHEKDGKPPFDDPELYEMLMLTALLHDGGRTQDKDQDTEDDERRSADLCEKVLKALGYDDAKAQMLKDVVIFKNDKNKFNGKPIAETCRSLLCQADSSHFLRFPHASFIFKYLDFYFVAKNNQLMMKDFLELLRNLKGIINTMKDSPEPFKHVETLPDGSKIIIDLPGYYSLKQKEIFTNTLTPFEDIFKLFSENPVFAKYLNNWFVSVPILYQEQAKELNLPDVYTVRYVGDKKTTDISIPGKTIDLKTHPYYANLFANQEQRKEYYDEKNKILKIDWKLSCSNDSPNLKDLQKETFYLALKDKKIYYIGSRTSTLTSISINQNDKGYSYFDAETKKYVDELNELLGGYSGTIDNIVKYAWLTRYIVEHIGKIISSKPDSYFPIDRTCFNVSTRPMAFAKGIERSFAATLNVGGTPPLVVFDNSNEVPADAADIDKFRDHGREDGAYISTSMDVKVAKRYAGSGNCTQLAIAPPGSIIEKAKSGVDEGKFEVNIIGGYDQEDVVIYQEKGKLFVRQSAIRKYGRALMTDLTQLFLEPNQVMFFSEAAKIKANEGDIQKFIAKIKVLENIEKLTYGDIEKNGELYRAFLDFFTDAESLCDHVKKENENVLKVNIYLALAASHREYFYSLLNTIDILKRGKFIQDKVGVENFKNIIVATDDIVRCLKSLPQSGWKDFLQDGKVMSFLNTSFDWSLFLERIEIKDFKTLEEQFGLNFIKAGINDYASLQTIMEKLSIPLTKQIQFMESEIGFDFIRYLVKNSILTLNDFLFGIPGEYFRDFLEKLTFKFVIEYLSNPTFTVNNFNIENQDPLLSKKQLLSEMIAFVKISKQNSNAGDKTLLYIKKMLQGKNTFAEIAGLGLINELYNIRYDGNATRTKAVDALKAYLQSLNSFDEIAEILKPFLENDLLYAAIKPYGIAILKTKIEPKLVETAIIDLNNYYSDIALNAKNILDSKKIIKFPAFYAFIEHPDTKFIENLFFGGNPTSWSSIDGYAQLLMLDKKNQIQLSDDLLKSIKEEKLIVGVEQASKIPYIINRILFHALLVSPKDWSESFYEIVNLMLSSSINDKLHIRILPPLMLARHIYDKLHNIQTSYCFSQYEQQSFPINLTNLGENDLQKIPNFRFFVFIHNQLSEMISTNKKGSEEFFSEVKKLSTVYDVNNLPTSIIKLLPEEKQVDGFTSLYRSLKADVQIKGFVEICDKIIKMSFLPQSQLSEFIKNIFVDIKESERATFISTVLMDMPQGYARNEFIDSLPRIIIRLGTGVEAVMDIYKEMTGDTKEKTDFIGRIYMLLENDDLKDKLIQASLMYPIDDPMKFWKDSLDYRFQYTISRLILQFIKSPKCKELVPYIKTLLDPEQSFDAPAQIIEIACILGNYKDLSMFIDIIFDIVSDKLKIKTFYDLLHAVKPELQSIAFAGIFSKFNENQRIEFFDKTFAFLILKAEKSQLDITQLLNFSKNLPYVELFLFTKMAIDKISCAKVDNGFVVKCYNRLFPDKQAASAYIKDVLNLSKDSESQFGKARLIFNCFSNYLSSVESSSIKTEYIRTLHEFFEEKHKWIDFIDNSQGCGIMLDLLNMRDDAFVVKLFCDYSDKRGIDNMFNQLLAADSNLALILHIISKLSASKSITYFISSPSPNSWIKSSDPKKLIELAIAQMLSINTDVERVNFATIILLKLLSCRGCEHSEQFLNQCLINATASFKKLFAEAINQALPAINLDKKSNCEKFINIIKTATANNVSLSQSTASIYNTNTSLSNDIPLTGNKNITIAHTQ